MKTKTCGRDKSCELELEHPTVSRFHAQIELAGDGLVSVQDLDSSNGTFLNRNDHWIRVRRVTLCIGDQIRFGSCEVPLEQLTTVFGDRFKVRLGARQFPPGQGAIGAGLHADMDDAEANLQKPRRNPSTGKIEEHQG